MKKAPKKKNDKTLFVVAVVVFALAVGLFVGSYARYYTSISMELGTVQTAAWSFTANGQTSTLTIDLLNPGANGSVSGLSYNGKIQPGSSGTYNIVLSAENSDVDVATSFTLNAPTWTGEGTPASGFSWTVKDGETPLSTNGATTTTITHGQTKTYTVEWEWTYGADRVDNVYAGQTLTMTGTVTGTQVNPGA